MPNKLTRCEENLNKQIAFSNLFIEAQWLKGILGSVGGGVSIKGIIKRRIN